MTTILQSPDTPCSYPSALGANVTTAIGNTPKILAVFRNEAPIDSLRAILHRIDFAPITPSADTLITIQLVDGNGTATGGTWVPIGGPSLLDINKTMTGYTGGTVAITMYAYGSSSHGNNPPSAPLLDMQTDNFGLSLYKGKQFALIASTQTVGATVSLAWAVNWLERD